MNFAWESCGDVRLYRALIRVGRECVLLFLPVLNGRVCEL